MKKDELVMEEKVMLGGTTYTSRYHSASVSLTPEMLARMDKFKDERGHNRSELVRFAVNKVLEANGF